jgi:hypothetical protein
VNFSPVACHYIICISNSILCVFTLNTTFKQAYSHLSYGWSFVSSTSFFFFLLPGTLLVTVTITNGTKHVEICNYTILWISTWIKRQTQFCYWLCKWWMCFNGDLFLIIYNTSTLSQNKGQKCWMTCQIIESKTNHTHCCWGYPATFSVSLACFDPSGWLYKVQYITSGGIKGLYDCTIARK